MNQAFRAMKLHLLPVIALALWALAPSAHASIAYGSVNNFDTVNDTGKECHGFEIELDDIHSTDISYTYDYNHYGTPKITEDNTDPAHPKVLVQYASARNPDGTWAAFTAIPSAPIAPTDGHMFTDPSVNFGGEHFGVGYNAAPTAVLYNWLVDNGSGVLVHGGTVQVSTPSFTYYPPVVANPVPPQVQAVIVPPPPPAPPPLEFGKAVWVKEIRTTTHNASKVHLRDLVSDDPNHPNAKNWKNGEPDEVEVEWQVLQKDYGHVDAPKNKLQAAAENLPNGNEVVTRRYEFYKYTGPLDTETGEAMAESVGPDHIHGVGVKTINGVSVDLSTQVVVGDFTGAQMAAVDVDAPVGLIDHVGNGEVDTPFAARTVVVQGTYAFMAVSDGALPPGMTFDTNTGILSGTPTASGQFNFSVTASDSVNPDVSKNYTLTVAAVGAALPPASLLDTAASPVGAGTTTGDGSFDVGASATVTASPGAGFAFLNWTDNGTVVSVDSSYSLTMDVNHSLVANFVPTFLIDTSSAPVDGGTTSGGGTVNSGDSVTITATPNAGYTFTNWTEAGAVVSTSSSYTFTADADHSFVANFDLPVTISTSGTPLVGGSTSGGGSIGIGSSVTVGATPNSGYTFTNWTESGVVVSASSSYTFTAAVDRVLVAHFAVAATYSVSTSASPSAGGGTSGGGSFTSGTSVTVTATPNAGYNFINWTVSGTQVSSSASYTFNLSANRTLVANFSAIGSTPRTITTSSNPVAGGVLSGAGTYADGTSVTVTAVANAGYAFSKWKEGSTNLSSSPSYTFTVLANRSLVATFTQVYYINASASPSAGGTTEMDSASYKIGDSAQALAKASAGYQFVNWTEGGNVVSTQATYSFSVTGGRTLVANFQLAGGVTITTSASPLAGGTTSGAGGYLTGHSVTVNATPNAGYNFSSWMEGATVVSSSPSYTFTASANRSLVATFVIAPKTWTITTNIVPAPGGNVIGGGSIADGSTVNLSAVASAGYAFSKWTEGGVDVSTSPNYSFTATADRTLNANFTLTSIGVKFDFDATPTALPLGQTLPFDQMAAGVTATFSSINADAFTVSDATTTGYTLSGLSGKYLVPGTGGTNLDIQFGQQITGATLNFALREALNLAPHSTLQLTAIDNMSSGSPIIVGTVTATGVNRAGDSLAGGTLSYSGTQPFDQLHIVVLTAAQADTAFLVDNISITPISQGGVLSLANPNWNITITDSGYSDLLLDNTPGFVGREYLSGEWGAAVGYKVGNSTRSPIWLERNFIYPDWVTNSDFNVVSPIALIGSNANGLPVAQSVIANNDLEITIRYEMIDTVTGVPMGVTAASTGGAGASINSNRYVLNQSYTIKNISGAGISNLQFFQFLHGFTSQHGVYDNRAYAGKQSEYRYDVTLGGIDATTIGVSGSSSTGLEDFIGFGSKVAPSAFEIGHYGIQGNGIDDHVIGKPSDGVHLSVENNWTSAPYNARQGTDSFAPANRWVAGAQRYEMGTLAAGQSVSIDVMLSILTGTTVTVTGGGGGGGNTGTGSCKGGSSQIGGVDFEINGITTEGTFFGEESEADDTEISERIADGEFVLPNFAQPGGLSQVWNLKFNGSYTGQIKLKFNYDPALLPPGFDAHKLTIWHYTKGAWEQLVPVVDTVNHVLTVMTSSLSPFMLGVPTTNAIPTVNAIHTGGGNQQLSWTSDTTGWVLQESADLATWVNSAEVVTTVGNVSTVNIAGGGTTYFYRLAHP